MTRNKLFLATFVLLLLCLPLYAQDGSKGNITGSAHDLSANNVTGELCGYCHVPHQLSGDNRTLLWNHSTTTAAAYNTYSSSTLNATLTALDQTNAAQLTGAAFYSLACLTCHDGATAPNVVYRIPMGFTGEGTPGSFGTAIPAITGPALIGTDLSNDHPVNFTYDAALAGADHGLFDPSSGVTIGSGIKTVRSTATWDTAAGIQDPVLFSGTVQCATCHNPHNKTYDPFLRISNSGSALCLRCHSTT